MVILAMALARAQAQTGAPPQPAANPAQRLLLLSSGQASVTSGDLAAQGETVREIDDPNSGKRWLLTLDPSHPGGPGQLRLVSAVRGGPAEQREPRSSEPLQAGPASGPASEQALPVIRSGDRVIVEEHTPVADARLEAVAMSPARAGTAFNARLIMGGWVVRAVAIAPGRAVLAEEKGR